MPFERVNVLMGDTAHQREPGRRLRLDRHPASAASRCATRRPKRAACWSRWRPRSSALPADQLTVTDGVVHAKSDRGQEGQLRRADRRALLQRPARVEQADRQSRSTRPARRKPKDPKDYKIVGKPIKRADIAPKVFAQEPFVTDIKVAGHGACPHDPSAGRGRERGQGRRSLDQGHPGARVVRENDFLAVVGRQGMGRGQGVPSSSRSNGRTRRRRSPSRRRIYDHIRKAPVRKREDDQAGRQRRRGVQDRRPRDRGRIRMAVPVARLHGPGLRGGRDQGRPRHLLDRLAEAAFRARRRRRARSACRSTRCDGIWVVGPGSYGRNDADDCAMDAAVLAKAVGKPGARCNTCASKAPAGTRRGRPRSTARAPRSTPPARSSPTSSLSKGFSRFDVHDQRQQARRHARRAVPRRAAEGRTTPSACRRNPTSSPTSAPRGRRSRRCSSARSPLRSAHLRDPVGPQIHFASEVVHGRGGGGARRSTRSSCACGTSRTRATSRCSRRRPRSRAGSRGPRRARTRAATRSAAAASPTRSATARACAIVAEVDVDRRTGKIWARKFTVAHDCGQIINPDGLKHTIEGNIIQGISRTLWEEVKFDHEERDQRRLADLSDPRHHRDAGDDRRASASTGPSCRRPAPASRRSVRSRRRSPTRSSTPPACACAGCRSRPTA